MEQVRGAVYLRLSKDDGARESSSITSQRMLLYSYAKENGIEIVKEFCDDGYSGTTFDRPAFCELINAVKSGEINIVMVKDLSRLGRDYIMTGKYTEEFFPEHNVRFIAVNDGFDTENGGSDLAPFRNVINEMYARDTSRKIRSALYAKMRNGRFVGNFAPYGYEKEKGKLVVGKAAGIVRKIYLSVINGETLGEIASELNEKGVLSPLDYRAESLGKPLPNIPWKIGTLRKIIKNPVYKGTLVQGKTRKLSFKSGKSKAVPDDMRYVVFNAHEKIVSDDEFELANRIIAINGNSQRKSCLSGFVFCGVCGERAKEVKPYVTCKNGCLSDVKLSEKAVISQISEKIKADFAALSLAERASIVKKVTASKDGIEVLMCGFKGVSEEK